MVSGNEVNNLAPEEVLLEGLSPLWRKRLEKAILVLHQNLSEAIAWPAIASECAVSASHLHRVFTLVMGEAPVKYQRRMRLKTAVLMLSLAPETAITDIALEVGFSSSQALAKALKKELGVSATDIRDKMSAEPESANQFSEFLLQKLGHPDKNWPEVLEKKLAEKIDFYLIHAPEQYFVVKPCVEKTPEMLFKRWQKMAPETVSEAYILTHYDDAADFSEAAFNLGYQCEPEQATMVLPEQQYLCCRVKVSSASGYFTAWESLYLHVLTNGYEIDEMGYLIEKMYNPRAKFSLSSDLCLMMPLN